MLSDGVRCRCKRRRRSHRRFLSKISAAAVVTAFAGNLVYTAAAAPATAETTHGSSGKSLLTSLGLDLPVDFFTHSFENRWSFLRAAPNARAIFQRIWGWRQVLRHASREGYKAYDRGVPRPQYNPEPGEDGEAKARDTLRKNLTLVQNHVHRSYAPLVRYMRRASTFFGLPGGMNSYTSPPGGIGFAYHFDPSDAFILQVRGSKVWEVCERHFTDPLGFSNLTYNQFPEGHAAVSNCQEALLQEGDAIYLPVGAIHRARTNEGVSIHLTMSLNRQFFSTAAMLLNVAEQINPSKEYGFAQRPFLAWVNRAVASPDGSLAALHALPRCLKNCGGRGKKGGRTCRVDAGFLAERAMGRVDPERPQAWDLQPEEFPPKLVRRFVQEMSEAIDLLKGHPSASKEVLRLGVRMEGRTEPVIGSMRPSQVLEGLAPLLGPDPCVRALSAWRSFYTRQIAEYDEILVRAETTGDDLGDDDDLYFEPGEEEDHEFFDALINAPSEQLPDFSENQVMDTGLGPVSTVSTEISDSNDIDVPFPWEYPEEGSHRDRLDEDEQLAKAQSVPSMRIESNPPLGPTGWNAADMTAAPLPPVTPAVSGIVYAVCCSAVSGKTHVRCANETAPPHRSETPLPDENLNKVLIVTYATPHVYGFARYSLAVNANWARRFGHSFVVDGRDLATDGVDVKNAKILVKHHWVSLRDIREQWVLWIGGDAVFAEFDEFREDVLRRVIATHGQDPRTQIIITRDPHGRAGNSMSLFNADVILLRRSDWTSAFLKRWWDDPRMREGRTDQEILELLYVENVLGASSAFVLLPPLTLNSDTLSIIAGPPRIQPVIHLGGHADAIRTAVFKEVLRMLCERPAGPDPDSLELQDMYIQALQDEVKDPGNGVSSGHVHSTAISGTFQRLAWHLAERGKREESIEIQRAALRHARKQFGARHRDTLQAAIALGGSLRTSGSLEESENLHHWAYQGMLETLGQDHRDTLTTANNLGLVLEARSRLGQAEALYRTSYEGLLRAVGAEAPAGLAAAFNLASVSMLRVLHGEVPQTSKNTVIAEAERLHRAVLLGRERIMGNRSALVLESRDALASLLVALGGPEKAREAEQLQRESLASRLAESAGTCESSETCAILYTGTDSDLLTPDGTITVRPDRATVQAHSTLAQALRMQGRLQEAVRHFEAAYRACLETPALGGPDSPNTLAAGSNLASALQDAGRPEEAAGLYRAAAQGLRRLLGDSHPNTRGAEANYERFRRESGYT